MRPLIAGGTEVVPTGTTRFQKKNEPGFFYMEVYEPLLTATPNQRRRFRWYEFACAS